MRLLAFTGKGGVGKTTLCAATALALADRGARTLVLSADPAHSLGDVLGQKLGRDPVLVVPNLHAVEVDTAAELDSHWSVVSDFLRRLFESQGLSAPAAAELAVLPGFDEVMALIKLGALIEEGAFDVALVDCAPTGSAFRLLTLPQGVRWYMDKIFPLERTIVPAIAPVVERFAGVPLPRATVFDAVDQLYRALARVGTMLQDRKVASVRLVTNLEPVVFAETARAYASLTALGFAVDGIIINKRIEAASDMGAFARGLVEQQGKAETQFQEQFWFLPQRRAAYEAASPIGVEALRAVAQSVYGAQDPLSMGVNGSAFRFEERGKGFTVHVELPTKMDAHVSTRAGELLIEQSGVRRRIALPEILSGLRASEAIQRDRFLTVHFEAREKLAS